MSFRFRCFCFFAVAAASTQAFALGCSSSDSPTSPVDAGAADVTTDAPSTVADASPDADASAPDADAAPRDAGLGDESEVVLTPDGALVVNTGVCNFGEIGATFMGVPAYCEPDTADGYYQCDELANRFMRDALHHPELDNVVTDYASSICGKVATNPAYSVWGGAYQSGVGHRPHPGDLVVFKGSPGHVAVITGFVTPTTVQIMQQNSPPVIATMAWDPNAAFFTAANAECWIHAEPAPVATLPTMPSCGCFDPGDTCGLAIVDHEWWYGCTAQLDGDAGAAAYNTLYSCANGVFSKKEDCSSQCVTPNLNDAGGACGQ